LIAHSSRDCERRSYWPTGFLLSLQQAFLFAIVFLVCDAVSLADFFIFLTAITGLLVGLGADSGIWLKKGNRALSI
jgi:hypothetical protein